MEMMRQRWEYAPEIHIVETAYRHVDTRFIMATS